MVDGDPFASRIAPASRPIPWGPILGGVGLLVLVLLVGFREQLFGADGPSPDQPPTAKNEPAKDEPAQAPAVDPAKDPAPPPAPVADATPPAPPPAPPPPADPAFDDKLAQARAAFDKRKLKAAEALHAELAQSRPDHPEVLLLGAQILLEKGDLAGSLAGATRCVEIAASQADCWLTLGILQQASKDNPAAIKAYETYLELAPDGRYARDATSQLARLKK